MEVDICMIYISVKVGKKKLILIFISRRSVFYFCGETNKYSVLDQLV